MKTILLIRHPETAMAGRFCGHSDPDLNAAGERQMASIAERVSCCPIDRILSSDLLRAARAAQAIGRTIGVAVEMRRGLREIGFGRWEGLAWSEIEAQFPREAASWLRNAPHEAAPGGEPYEMFSARIRDEFEPLLTGSQDCFTAIVTHRGVMDFALTTFFNISKADAWKTTAHYGATLRLTRGPHSIIQSAGDDAADTCTCTLEVL